MNDCSVSNLVEVAGGYWKNATYLPNGAVQQAKLGNGAVETSHYNNRLQPDVQELVKGTSLWKLETGYTAGTRRNVGNVLKQTLTVGGIAGNLVTAYQYDGLDRLTMATEQPADADNPQCTGAGSGAWCQGYGLDGYGNRTITARYPAGDATGWVASVFNPETNRATDTGWTYSGRGELVKNGAGEQMAYDAEGRVTAWCGSGQTAQSCGPGTGQVWAARMVYDAEGRRVRKDAGGSSETYVYGAGGELLAEYGSGGPAGVQYLTTDGLGSTRVVTDGTGAVATRMDYEPYGTLRTDGAWRSGVPGYSGSGVRLQFTGKERDAETGLDYFGARYFSGAQGRFTSPDPLRANVLRVINPQRWNMYAYGLNNPLTYVDPDGRDAIVVNYSKMAVGMGHQAIVSVHRDGTARFAEFGPKGFSFLVKWGHHFEKTLDTKIAFGSNGLPTEASYAALIKEVGGIEPEKQSPGSISLAYFKTSDADTAALDGYINWTSSGWSFPYIVDFYDCRAYVLAGLQAARVDYVITPTSD